MITIRADGVRTTAAALNSPTLLGPAAQMLVDAAADAGQGIAEDRAPKKTGRLRGDLTKRLSGQQFSRKGTITTNVSNNGFRYGWALETSKRRVYRYRSSGPRGESTRGWMSGTVKQLVTRLVAALSRADSDIARRWNTT